MKIYKNLILNHRAGERVLLKSFKQLCDEFPDKYIENQYNQRWTKNCGTWQIIKNDEDNTTGFYINDCNEFWYNNEIDMLKMKLEMLDEI